MRELVCDDFLFGVVVDAVDHPDSYFTCCLGGVEEEDDDDDDDDVVVVEP
jgi:hypothetical protein